MKSRSNIIRIDGWVYSPAKRAHRFRCVACAHLVQDHTDLVIERGNKWSRGYHAACFDNSAAGKAAKGREAERFDPKRDERSYA